MEKKWEPWVNSAARSVWREQFRKGDRLLILGASGWFGRTAIALTHSIDVEILLIAQNTRTIELGGRDHRLFEWNSDLIQAFRPTIVLDLWFLTREKAESVGVDAYVAANMSLVEKTRDLMKLDSVSRMVTISSGAAVDLRKNSDLGTASATYGHIKLEAESAMTSAALDTETSLSIARVYSVSGSYVTRPHAYAFSNLLNQAMSGKIKISADKQVWRKYVPVEDVLVTGLANCLGGVTLFSTGGPLIEIGELAKLFARLVNNECSISRPKQTLAKHPDNYFAKDDSWNRAIECAGLASLNLEDQAKQVLSALRNTQPRQNIKAAREPTL